ncbi:hypothetical protein AAFC00_005500 [Neodothiora populina]|uniref:Uncharacterized protein n=1 Tax=Neodothiora populina TaxID=2781224 RepID=A0ABR3PLG2_9PEZI
MSDAVCGPSNALQNFKQHTSVDRSLQQDRIVSRHQPSQAFRSPDPNAGVLDPEFEAFQAAQPSVFAGSSLPLNQSFHNFGPANSTCHHGPSAVHAGPSQIPAWASDFQTLHNSASPALSQPLVNNQNNAWASQFQQSSGKSPMHTGPAPSSVQYSNAPAYPMARTFSPAFRQPQMQLPLPQQMQLMQAPKEEFDEEAFQAAFDAAMSDALQSQSDLLATQEKSQEAETEAKDAGFDIYPDLPLIRLALLTAIVDGSDGMLHEAALFVHHLNTYDPEKMDPAQAMLLRPLITRLADATRSPFVKRYDASALLQELSTKLESVGKNAKISPEHEQLLAAYADCLWGRDQTNHLANVSNYHADTSYWRVSLEENLDNFAEGTPTSKAMKMLAETNLFGFSTPQSMHRVQDLEIKAYQNRPLFKHQARSAEELGSTDPQAILFSMAMQISSAPELRDAIYTDGVEEHQRRIRSSYIQSRQNAPVNVHSLQAQAQAQQLEEEAAMLQEETMQDNHADYLEQQRWNEQVLEVEREEQKEDHQPTKDDDELAQTAADLLSKMSSEKSNKFQNSAFMGLMRKLADREVRVEGDKMVETSTSTAAYTAPVEASTTTAAPSTWSQDGPMQAHQPRTEQQPHDGQEVVDLLNRPDELSGVDDSIEDEQSQQSMDAIAEQYSFPSNSADFLMTSPFADAGNF